MKYIKSYKLFENSEYQIPLIKLITYNGEVLDQEGYVEEGIGIFDNEGGYIDYIAGVDKDGLIYGTTVNMYNYVFGGTNNEPILMNICLDYEYEGQEKFYPLGSYEGQKQLIQHHPERIKDIEKNYEKINPQILEEFKDILKQSDWS